MIYNDFNEIPKNKYDIIYADPPWAYDGSGGTKWSRADNYYKTMSFDELKSCKVGELASENSLLFMWVVSPELDKCIEVGKSWGFKYITVAFVWYKRRANVGNYTMPGCELCLLFKKGKIPKDRVRNPGQKQFFEEKIRKHSQKPDEFRTRIEKMYPKSSKIELFARNTFDNWDSFGDEI